jgi:hypothetical protein
MSVPSQSTKRLLWLKRFSQFEKSDLTIAQFCHSIGCSVPTFYQWRRKLASPTGDLPKDQTRSFLQVETAAMAAIRLELPSGVVISIPLHAIDSLPRILEPGRLDARLQSRGQDLSSCGAHRYAQELRWALRNHQVGSQTRCPKWWPVHVPQSSSQSNQAHGTGIETAW